MARRSNNAFTFVEVLIAMALLAVLHLALAVRLRNKPTYASPVYAAGFALAALADRGSGPRDCGDPASLAPARCRCLRRLAGMLEHGSVCHESSSL